MYQNLAQMYQQSAEKFGDRPAFGTKIDGSFRFVTFRSLYDHGVALATALIDLGVKPREHIGLLADNRIEWILADYGVQLAGAADVPRGTDVTDQDIGYILPHSDAKICFVENQAILDKVKRNASKLKKVKTFIMMDRETPAKGKGVLHMYALIEKGKALRAKGDRRVEDRIAQIGPDDLFTMIYTSGTTGAPKGVMLTHGNAISQLQNLSIGITGNDRFLSILPVWHIFERAFEIIAIERGATLFYTNLRSIGDDLKLAKPTFMASAPRLWESIYLKIMGGVEKAPAVRRAMFNAAMSVSRGYNGAKRYFSGQELKATKPSALVWILRFPVQLLALLGLLIPNFLLDQIVMKKLRAATGGDLRASCSGGGALPLHVDEFFNNIGIPVLEGYGMTETSPIISCRTEQSVVIGSVGPIYPGTQLRLVNPSTGDIIWTTESPDDSGLGVKGEIHVKGPQVMKGYYKNPEATQKVLKDGWMNTGDLGIMTWNNTLKIMGRSKETIVLMNGENVEPVPIEVQLVKSPLIDQCMVVGQDKKTLSVLVVPALEGLAAYGGDVATIAASTEAQELVKAEVRKLISAENGFKVFEKVLDVRLLPKAFEVGDEMTNLFKLKRHVITDKYEDLIESMY